MKPIRNAFATLVLLLGGGSTWGNDLLLVRPGVYEVGAATMTILIVANEHVDLSVKDAGDREILGFDLGSARSRWFVFSATPDEVWAYSGDLGTFGWRREADGLYRAIEMLDADGRLIHRLPDAFFDRLPATLKGRWVESQVALNPEPPPAGMFRIKPTRPIEQIRAEALTAEPPKEEGEFLKADLVDLTTLDPRIKLEIRYATPENFLGVPVYTTPRAFLQRPAAEALKRAQVKLGEKGLGLLIHDGYRPWYVTKIFREATPPKYHDFVADPAKGSRHNRGCAVDLSLYDLKTGKAVDMPTGYDDFSRCAFADYPGVTRAQALNRATLRKALEDEGFIALPEEWWHFDYQDWRKYPIQNVPFEKLGAGG
ncbi:M15 family metallopeptidase [Paludisphaera rhizosphaerae]|uniref:M15 family metallopeptidase n=1 Tax=Paludisphaera rhizosphaerae TaxID=2711216 RepID=UPI00197F6FE8|nr:M15 family metallopeptidase [Paludisphaera rhizosphaerae]